MSAADKIQAARALIEPLTGHSLGPWRADDAPYGYDVVSLPAKDSEGWWVGPINHIICPHSAVASSAVEADPETTLANARLCAAAPALRDTVAALADLADAQAQENARQAQRIEALEEALRFYANPVIYQPHPHGPAFDRRDVSYVAVAALGDAP